MSREAAVRFVQNLTDKQVVEFFAEATRGRNIYPQEFGIEAHLVLSNAIRSTPGPGHSSAPWELEVLALPKGSQDWQDESPICQFTTCCGHRVASWAKQITCPICGAEAQGT